MPIHVVITSPDSLDEPNPEIKVQADGLESQDQLATLLLTVIERITGISTNDYVERVNEGRAHRTLTPEYPHRCPGCGNHYRKPESAVECDADHRAHAARVKRAIRPNPSSTAEEVTR